MAKNVPDAKYVPRNLEGIVEGSLASMPMLSNDIETWIAQEEIKSTQLHWHQAAARKNALIFVYDTTVRILR